MVLVKCEKTGIEFEAPTRRTRNHPTVMSWLSKANEEGWYRQANEAIYGTYSMDYQDKQHFDTIEQFITYFEELRTKAMQENAVAAKERSESERAAKEAKRQRHITNDLLRGRGYHWQKFENDEEDQDFFGAPEHEWTLYSPDNRAVSVQEAMQELASQNVKFAKEWLAERHIAEEVPAIEKQKQEEVETAQAAESTQNSYKRNATQALMEAGLSHEDAEKEAERLSQPHSALEDRVQLTYPVQITEDDSISLVINGDFRYGVEFGEHWYGIEEMLRLHDFLVENQELLQTYKQRNEENRYEGR